MLVFYCLFIYVFSFEIQLSSGGNWYPDNIFVPDPSQDLDF